MTAHCIGQAMHRSLSLWSLSILMPNVVSCSASVDQSSQLSNRISNNDLADKGKNLDGRQAVLRYAFGTIGGVEQKGCVGLVGLGLQMHTDAEYSPNLVASFVQKNEKYPYWTILNSIMKGYSRMIQSKIGDITTFFVVRCRAQCRN